MKSALRCVVVVAVIGTGVLVGWWAVHGLWPPAEIPVDAVTATADNVAESQDRMPAPLPAPAGDATPRLTAAPVVGAAASLVAQIEVALRSGDDADRERVLNFLFPALVAQDRAAARRFVETLAPGEMRDQLLRGLVRAWAAADFAGAVAWIASLPDTVERKAAFEAACFQAAETNPVEAIRAWESLEFTDDDHVLENLVHTWAGKDLASARAWVSARPPGPQRDHAVARVAYVMAGFKPADAAAFITREIPPGPVQIEAAISVLHQWARSDLAGATAWVAQFPPGTLADRAQNELAGVVQYPAPNGARR